MALTAIEKRDRKTFKKELKLESGQMFSFPGEGVTVLVCPSTGIEDSFFVEIAAAFCDFDSGDEFNRKFGEFLVLQRWVIGKTVKLPRIERTDEEIAYDFLEICK